MEHKEMIAMKQGYGIIGCGSISRFHFNGLEKAGAGIVRVADVDMSRAAQCAARFGAAVSSDWREVLDDPKVSVVSVLAPARLHREICLAAIEAGKHIICEKTMAADAGEAYDIACAVRNSGTIFFTAFMKRFFPAVEKAVELLPSLGRLFSAHVRTYQNWGDLYSLKSASDHGWILEGYGGGIIKCAGSHMLDLMLHLLGRPAGVYADIDYVSGSRLDRKAMAQFKYPGSLAVNFEAVAHPLTGIGYERNSWDEKIEISGTGGRLEIYTVKWDTPENNAALLVHYDNERAVSTEYRFAAVNPFDLEMAHFNDCLRRGVPAGPDVIDGFNVDVLIAAMEEAHAAGKCINIDWKGL